MLKRIREETKRRRRLRKDRRWQRRKSIRDRRKANLTVKAERIAAHEKIPLKRALRVAKERLLKRRWRKRLSAPPPGTIFALMKVYGAKCLRCGISASETMLTVDHVTPVSKGGPTEMPNFQPLCGSCNRWKGDRTIDFRPQQPVAVASVG